MYLKIKVKLGKDFLDQDGNNLIVGLKSTPEHGKANQELIKKLAKHFCVDKSEVKIISGLNSKNKVVEIKSRRV